MHITIPDDVANYAPSVSDGMTIRETMAMHICAGYCANAELTDRTASSVAAWSAEQADALIAALNEEPTA